MYFPIKIMEQLRHNCRMKIYPDGSRDVLACDRAIFRESGWEEANKWDNIEERAARAWEALMDSMGPEDVERSAYALQRREAAEEARRAENLSRAKRRAKSAVSDLALSNDFRWFVTLTLDPEKVNRYDPAEVTRKLNNWCDNHVRRDGLKYVLVAERHKDGAIHFHGFFNDCLKAVDSGTISRPGHKKPMKPRSAAQRAAWLAEGGHVVYNLPAWSLGFTTAIELYGERHAAVGYVCKYISKEAEKVGGRWYYSGGDLKRPKVVWCDVEYDELCQLEVAFSFDELCQLEGAYSFELEALGAKCCRFNIPAQVGEGGS